MRGGLTLRVLVATVVPALIVGGTFALLLGAISAEREASVLSLQSREALSTADRLERQVVDLETGVRGYLLTGDERFLEPWTAARQAALPEAMRLRQLLIAPEQRQTAVQIERAIGSYIDHYSVPLVEAARRGDTSVTSIAASGEGKRRVDEIRALFDTLIATERNLLSSRDANSIARDEQALITAAVGLGVSVVFTLLLAAYLTRSIVRPVRRAAQMANQVAGGDLTSRVPETGVGEIRTLERSFNQMGASLERNHDQLAQLIEEQAALRRVATLIAHGEPPAAVFAAVVEEAAEVLDVDGVRMLRREADGSATVLANSGVENLRIPVGERMSTEGHNAVSEVFRTGRIARAESFSGPEGSFGAFADKLGVRLAVAAPIIVEGQVWGVMGIVSLRPRQPEEIEPRLAQFTDLVATAVANSQAREDLAASRVRLVAAGDETRRRIERDLHDGIQQRLVSVALELRGAHADVPDELPELRDQLSKVAIELGASLDDLREISRGIHPAILSEGGLVSALKALARRSAVPVDLDVDITTRPAPAVEAAAYYVAAEALTNATKHAEASVVRIDAADRGDRLEISIVDDGVGGADPAAGSGLMGLIDRVDALGGRIVVTSPPGAGTQVHVQLPPTPVP